MRLGSYKKKERKNLLENFLHQSQKWLTAKNKFLVFRATAASRDFVNFYKFTYWARFFTTYLIKNYLPKRLILQLSLICICVHFRPTPYLLTCKVLEVYCRSFQIIKGVTFKPILPKLFTFFPTTYQSNFTQTFFLSFTQKIVYSIYLQCDSFHISFLANQIVLTISPKKPCTKCLILNNLQWFENVTPLASFEQTIIKKVGWVGQLISCLMHEFKCISKRLFFKQGGVTIIWIRYQIIIIKKSSYACTTK